MLNNNEESATVSPLGQAIVEGNYGMVSRLLSEGADPDEEYEVHFRIASCVRYQGYNGIEAREKRSALALAIYLGKNDIAKCLLQHGACVNYTIKREGLEFGINHDYWKDYGERTILEIAIGNNNVESVKLLLDNHADPNTKTYYYSYLETRITQTPLISAIRNYDDPEVIRLLVKAGAIAGHCIVKDEQWDPVPKETTYYFGFISDNPKAYPNYILDTNRVPAETIRLLDISSKKENLANEKRRLEEKEKSIGGLLSEFRKGKARDKIQEIERKMSEIHINELDLYS